MHSGRERERERGGGRAGQDKDKLASIYQKK